MPASPIAMGALSVRTKVLSRVEHLAEEIAYGW